MDPGALSRRVRKKTQMATFVGPCEIDCPVKCNVPKGYDLTDVPPPRHDWSDVMACPNGGEQEALSGPCGRHFLVKEQNR